MAYSKSKTDAVGAKVKELGGGPKIVVDDGKLAALRAWGAETRSTSEVEAWIMHQVALHVEVAAK